VTTRTPNKVTAIVLTVEEAAELLGCGRTTMYGLIKTGEIASIPIGRLRRVPVGAIHEYVKRLLANATPSQAA
jgi:excisionase family DNA binding protein